MVCGHCRKSYPDNYSYCPYCAEPKPKPKPTVDEQYIAKQSGRGVFCGIAMALFAQLVGLLWTVVGMFVIGLFMIFCVAPFLVWAGWYGFHKRAVETTKKNDRKSLILKQFTVDKTSICPSCGSHSISLGRKGYDWNKGFWYSVFDVPGGRYLAGMDGRRIICYCDNCNNRWESDKVWIK